MIHTLETQVYLITQELEKIDKKITRFERLLIEKEKAKTLGSNIRDLTVYIQRLKTDKNFYNIKLKETKKQLKDLQKNNKIERVKK
ncbi:hypothetical protein [Methanoculleus sp.]|uniref:hypothetical protein n=1 Tax=Methanoculleus sp. TaxID=90427 RepID=UPI0025FD3718|nr:hypothetical protein [Methanoculleus sp.]MCK9319876.1 hypothetical protein [Methanoculleus sp.]